MELAKQVQELMVFSKPHVFRADDKMMFKSAHFFNPFSVIVNNKQYELKAIHFYNKDGIVYSVNSGWFGNNNEWGSITLADSIVYRKKEKFDGVPFILPRKKEWRTDGLLAEIYLPMAYLESLGYEEKMTESINGADHYKRYRIETPYFDFHLKTEHNEDKQVAQDLFNNLKMELIMAIDKCDSREKVSEVLKKYEYKF